MSLWSEIHEQPDVLDNLVAVGRKAAADAVTVLGYQETDWTHIVIAARGTSDNAARYASYVWGNRNRITVALATPSLYGPYESAPTLDGALVVGISQSGQSPDLVEVLAEAKRQGRPTLAITNHAESPMGLLADVTMTLEAGVEKAVAATKTYTTQLMVIALLSEAWAGWSEPDIDRVADAVRATLAQADQVEGAAQSLLNAKRAVVLGRGFNFATAFEWALKLQELTYLLAHPFSTADFRHGPLALVEPGLPVLAICPDGPLLAEQRELLHEVAQKGAEVIVITNQTDLPGHVLPLPGELPEWLTPIPAIVMGQLLCHRETQLRSLDPEHPRGLNKVTLTT